MHGEVNLAYPDSHALEIRQTTDKAILHWHEFNIAPGETTRFIHPHDQAITLNRVTSHQSSQILGNLSANGRVILVNPAGIYFGPQAKVNVGSLLATTANIKNEDFLADHYLFEDHPDSIAAVINHGTLTAHDQGLIALVAPTVENRGVIHAHLGKVSLAAGTKFSIDLYGDQLIQRQFGVSQK